VEYGGIKMFWFKKRKKIETYTAEYICNNCLRATLYKHGDKEIDVPKGKTPYNFPVICDDCGYKGVLDWDKGKDGIYRFYLMRELKNNKRGKKNGK
jgi:hypothetical protein